MDFGKLSIENLTKEQFAQIVEIEENSGLEPYTSEMLLECIENLDTFVCFDGGRVVGFITLHNRSRYFGGSLYIVNLNVAKAYRGQGIAKKLMYTVYEYYVQDHADKLVSLDVTKTNRAMELYKKVGFQIVDIPSRNGDSDVVMAIPLTVLGENSRILLAEQEYVRNPCRAASIPYWKAVSVSVPENMQILHENDFRNEILERYIDEPYFRLKHDLQDVTLAPIPEGFSLCAASVSDFTDHINGCYGGACVTADELQSYTKRKVYCSGLWVAIQDERTGEIVATGIAELDREMGEGVLEWIQVSAGYRGRGLGRYIVKELLWRMKDKAKFVTVSGRCNNLTKPEALYRKCGFDGNDVWHILRKR